MIDEPSVEPLMIASEGTHVILPGEYVNKNHGLILPATEDGRVIFVLPYQNKALVGTTDNIYPEMTNNPKTDPNALTFLCKELVKLYPLRTEEELRNKIISYWTGFILKYNFFNIESGLRPLVKNPNTDTEKEESASKVSRMHVIEVSPSNLISLMGGK